MHAKCPHFTFLVHLHSSHIFWYNRDFSYFLKPTNENIFHQKFPVFFQKISQIQNCSNFWFLKIKLNFVHDFMFSWFIFRILKFSFRMISIDFSQIHIFLWFSRVFWRVFLLTFWNVPTLLLLRFSMNFWILTDNFHISNDFFCV